MRASLVLLMLIALAVSPGCIGNMGELKEAIGVTPPEPTYLPPEARAQANATAVVTGVPVRFTAEGTRDAQGLPLVYRWTFSPAGTTRAGLEVTEAFMTPGEWRVTLNVTNEAGLSDESAVIVQVAQASRAPIAQVLVRDAAGAPADSGDMHAPLRFEAQATDADDDIASYEWDFGDGATSHDAHARHAYDAPGLYTVKLRVADRAGNVAHASRLVAIHGAWAFDGAFGASASSSDARAHAFPLADGARELRATLTFPAGFGSNDATLVLQDKSGVEIARSEGETAPGSQGQQKREIVLAAEALAAYAPGDWTLLVVKTKGLQFDYALAVDERF